MIFAGSLLMGVLSGMHAATWGAYKDSPFEGFRKLSYLRSVLVAAGISAGPLLERLDGDPRHPSLIATLGAVYALERFATEWWKAILRNDDQSSYSIPMRLAVKGKPLDRNGTRYVVGTAGILCLVGMIAAVGLLQRAFPNAPGWLVVITAGAAGGWATAVGGAWKDAPVEGFSGWKFLRSPAAATGWAVPLSLLTNNWILLLLASGGFAVASIETYKTFCTGDRPPGKFANRPVRHNLPVLRIRLGWLHAALWAVFSACLVVTISEPEQGLGTAALASLAVQLPTAVLTAVAVSAAFVALFVFRNSARMIALGAAPREARTEATKYPHSETVTHFANRRS